MLNMTVRVQYRAGNIILSLALSFFSFELNHVNMLADESFHSCAHRASSERRRCMWINFTPPFLASILSKDCNTAA